MAKMKLKTLSGAKKRFKMTASGKIKRNASKRRHILTKKTTKLTRGLRMPKYVDKSNEATVRKMMPYGGWCCKAPKVRSNTQSIKEIEIWLVSKALP